MTPRSGDAEGQSFARSHADRAALDDLRAELEIIKDREREIVELLGAESPERIIHDLRNVLNELQLLRIVVMDNNA
jgi:hypothetical protein